jgi:hypothetical protein
MDAAQELGYQEEPPLLFLAARNLTASNKLERRLDLATWSFSAISLSLSWLFLFFVASLEYRLLMNIVAIPIRPAKIVNTVSIITCLPLCRQHIPGLHNM